MFYYKRIAWIYLLLYPFVTDWTGKNILAFYIVSLPYFLGYYER